MFPSPLFTDTATNSVAKYTTYQIKTKHMHPEARTTLYSRKQFLGAWCCHAVEQATVETRKLNNRQLTMLF